MAFAPILMLAAAAVSAYGMYQQGQSAKKAGEYNAKIATQNAGIAKANAESQAKQHDREMLMRLGAIKANIGASGGTGAGSALDLLSDEVSQGELQRQNILYRGDLEARGYKNTAGLENFEGKAASNAATFRAGSELLAGAGQAYDSMSKQAPAQDVSLSRFG